MVCARVVVVALLFGPMLAACSDDSSDESGGDATTTTVIAPRQAFAQLPAPEDTTYISESPIDTTGYWVAYAASDVSDATMTNYAETLAVDGWASEDTSSEGFNATTDGAWLDVVVSSDSIDGGPRIYVCVWNAKPDKDECAGFAASLSAIPTTTTDAG